VRPDRDGPRADRHPSNQAGPVFRTRALGTHPGSGAGARRRWTRRRGDQGRSASADEGGRGGDHPWIADPRTGGPRIWRSAWPKDAHSKGGPRPEGAGENWGIHPGKGTGSRSCSGTIRAEGWGERKPSLVEAGRPRDVSRTMIPHRAVGGAPGGGRRRSVHLRHHGRAGGGTHLHPSPGTHPPLRPRRRPISRSGPQGRGVSPGRGG